MCEIEFCFSIDPLGRPTITAVVITVFTHAIRLYVRHFKMAQNKTILKQI